MPTKIDELVPELEVLFEISKSSRLSSKKCKGWDDIQAKFCEYLQGLEG